MQLVDLSLATHHGSLSYPGTSSGIEIERISLDSPDGTLSRLTHFDPHCGTHYDAPLHFASESDDVSSVPLVLPDIIVICCSENPIPRHVLDGLNNLEGKAVLFSTGWERLAGTKAYFSGFPALSPELAEALVAHRVALVGLDSPSVDAQGTDYPAHKALLGAGIPILEGLVNLCALGPLFTAGKRIQLAAFPLRIVALEASPVRAVAIVA